MRKTVVVVGAGSGTRFGGDKMMALVGGVTVVARTVSAFYDLVDDIVLVVGSDMVEQTLDLGLRATVVPGGDTRTKSEMGGLAALGGERDLIGIHDGGRPLVSRALIEDTFSAAADVGGAAPVVQTGKQLISRLNLEPLVGAVTVQTPQVFRAPDLLAAYDRAAQSGFSGHDTVDVMHRFSSTEIVAVPGDPRNIKITYPEDLLLAERYLAENADT